MNTLFNFHFNKIKGKCNDICINGRAIEIDNNRFILETKYGKLNCIYKKKGIKVDKKYTIYGTVKSVIGFIGNYKILVDRINVIDDRNYEKYEDEVRKKINHIANKEITFISNVCIFVFGNINIDPLKINFHLKCFGKLYIYHVENYNMFYKNLIYVQKYYDVNLFCLYINEDEHTNEIYSLNNIKYLIEQNKIYTVLVSRIQIISCELFVRSCSKFFKEDQLLNFIFDIQKKSKEKINNITNKIKFYLLLSLNDLFKQELTFYNSVNNNPYTLKELLYDKLDEKYNEVTKFKDELKDIIIKDLINMSNDPLYKMIYITYKTNDTYKIKNE